MSIELAKLVFQMRSAQKSYFKNRTQGDLNESKRLERLVDEAVKAILNEDPQAEFNW
jgi:hypothetical protein